MTATVADLVRRGLVALGVEAVYGRPFPGLAVAEVRDAEVAALVAEAHLLVLRTRCAVHRGDGEFALHDRGARSAPVTVAVGDEAGPLQVEAIVRGDVGIDHGRSSPPRTASITGIAPPGRPTVPGVWRSRRTAAVRRLSAFSSG